MIEIYSFHNNRIKSLIQKKRKKKIFLVEGCQEFKMALIGGFIPHQIFICKNIFLKYDLIKNYKAITYFISIEIFKKLAYRGNSNGIISAFKEKKFNRLKNIKFKEKKNHLILILDGIEKPGNLGSMLRIADSVGFDFVILCNIKTYIFNPNVIRCSLGSVFTNNIIIEKAYTIFSWLKKNKIQIIVAELNNQSKNLYNVKFSNFHNISIVFGSENKGVSTFWIKKNHKIIKIPMFGKIDSLNVNSAMSIITYEIVRQRFYSKL